MGSKRSLSKNKKKCAAYEQRGTLERNKRRNAEKHEKHLKKAAARKMRNHPEKVA